MSPTLGPKQNAGQINGIPIIVGGPKDGQVLIFNSDQAGFGDITFVDSIRLMAGSALIPDINPANFAVIVLSNGLPETSIGFTTDTEEAYFVVTMPRDWNGEGISVIIEWSTVAAVTNKGAMFEIWGRRVAAGEVNTSSLIYLDTTVVCLNGGVDFDNNTAELNLGTLTGSGRKLQLMIKRDKTGEAGDSINDEVKVTVVEIFYTRTLGG
jgi:hypothetical protein